MGFNPHEVRIRDFAIGIVHSTFQVTTTLWLMTPRHGYKWVFLCTFNTRFFFTLNGPICQLEQHIIHEDPNVVPKLEDCGSQYPIITSKEESIFIS